MNWLLLYEIVYMIIRYPVFAYVLFMIHRTTTKTLAYLLFVIFLPFAGIFFYFLLELITARTKMYSKKLFER